MLVDPVIDTLVIIGTVNYLSIMLFNLNIIKSLVSKNSKKIINIFISIAEIISAAKLISIELR